jgi:hypothetical protein
MKRLILTIIASALCSLSLAETPGVGSTNNQPNGTSQRPFSTANCSFTFTSGAKANFLKYCVTANGNVTLFETPSGHEHIAVGQDGEGYGICDENTGVAYFDYAEFGDSANWNNPTVLSQDAKSVKIARTTTDGIWTLTQTFTQISGSSPSVKIGMALKNNSIANRVALLVRYADVDADGISQNSLDGTANTAFGFQPAGNGIKFGLALQNTGTTTFHQGYAQTVPQGPDPCNPFANFALSTLTNTDGSIIMLHDLHVPTGSSKTATVSYRGL